MYRSARKQWDGKKHRVIRPMNKKFKKMSKRLHKFFQRQPWWHGAAHGSICHRSCFTSAARHVGQRHVFTRDVENCFPSITTDALYRQLLLLRFKPDVADLLAKLMTCDGTIPQGCPTSTDAVNLFFAGLDQRLASTAAAMGAQYSRVVDDVVVSAKDKDAGQIVINRVEHEFERLGLKTNLKKKQTDGYRGPHQKRHVHGLDISSKRGVQISRQCKEKALAVAQSYLDSCKSATPLSLESIAAKRERAMGYMQHLRQGTGSTFRQLDQKVKAGDRAVQAKLRRVGVTCRKNRWWIIRGPQDRITKAARNIVREVARQWHATKYSTPSSSP
ncbi:reverse transcriptase domain-containing protein [Stieleria magnilauensis]